MTNTYRADHIGSLLRPQALLDARTGRQQGRITADELREIEDDSVRHVLTLQRQAGIDVCSDGEFRRSSWVGGFLDVAEGLVRPQKTDRPVAALWHGEGESKANDIQTSLPVIGGKLKVNGRFTGTEAAFLKANARGPFKITMPSPTMMLSFYQAGISDAAYPDQDEVVADLLAIYEREIDGLVADGVPYIQIDSLRYVDLIDADRRKALEQRGIATVLDKIIAADNVLLRRAKQPGVTRAIHICRGNHRSSWFGTGGYDAVAEQLFAGLETDRFLLEFDDERSGGFEPLRFVPPEKTVVLGLITTKSATLESQDLLMRRVEEASKFVPLERLAISPQCGFASTHLGNLVTEDDERRKLELVATTARRIWGTA